MKHAAFAFLVLLTACFAQPSQKFQLALLKENGEGDLPAAIELYEQIVADTTADRSLQATAQLHIGMCWEKMGRQEANASYAQVIEHFADQKSTVAIAEERLA